MAGTKPRESDLYAPVKAFLEQMDFEVKGEVGAADIVAVKADDDPVIVELKTGFTLTLVHQAIARQAITDWVYVAVPHEIGRMARKRLAANLKLCRRLGIGLLTVRLSDGFVTPHLDPGPYQPRLSKARRTMLLREHARRVGDPNTGGTTRRTVVTAYRQDALRCARILLERGPTKASEVAAVTGVDKARRLMSDDHYGWFARADRGVYELTPVGMKATQTYRQEIERLSETG